MQSRVWGAAFFFCGVYCNMVRYLIVCYGIYIDMVLYRMAWYLYFMSLHTYIVVSNISLGICE